MPAHHNLEEYMSGYIEAAGIGNEKHTHLFRTARGKTQQLTERGITQPEVYPMIRRRAAGTKTLISCHTFRTTGITAHFFEMAASWRSRSRWPRMSRHELPGFTIGAAVTFRSMRWIGL